MRKKKSILFRVDASSRTGLGHLRRCLALGMELKKRGHAPVFFVDTAGEKLFLPMPLPRARTLKNKHWDMAIVDSYTISAREYQRIRSVARCVVVVVDHADPGFACDALLNHNVYARAKMYPRRQKQGTKLLTGPGYALMREQIVRARKRGYVVKKKIQKVLLTFGGGLARVQIKRLMRLVSNVAQEVEVLVLTTDKKIKSLLPVQLPNANRYRVLCNPRDVGAIMRQVDLAVSASGVTSLELACIGVPSLYVVMEENQRKSAQQAHRSGMGFNLGVQRRWTLSEFSRAYRFLENIRVRRSFSRRARLLVDGRGVQRCARALEKLF